MRRVARLLLLIGSLGCVVGLGGCGAGGLSSGAARRTPPFRDTAGWSVGVPAGWHLVRFRDSRSGVTAAGFLVSNVRLAAPAVVPRYPIQVSDRVLPPGGVGLFIATDTDPGVSRGVVARLPLSPPGSGRGRWSVGSAPAGGPYLETLWFRSGGRTFIASAKVGPEASATDLRALARIVVSLRRLPSGNVRRGTRRSSGVRRPPAGVFVSLVPACACGRHTELEEFSTRVGRVVQRLGSVSLGGYEQLGTPAATSSGRLLLLFTSQAPCTVTDDMECPRFVADGCRNTVESYDAARNSPRVLFTVPGSEAVEEAVPSPDGSRVALVMKPCTARRGATGLFIRDLASGRTRPILTSANPCDGYGRPAWNAAGTKIALPVARAYGPPIVMAGGLACPGARDRLAILTITSPRRLALIKPGRACLVDGVAFDRAGVAAAEGCSQGSPHGFFDPNLGNAYLLQFTRKNRLVKTLPLKRGMEEALLATVPHTGDVLLTEDQPANEGPEYDWVWQYDRDHLRLIRRYNAYDAAQVLAVPW